jgi:hypothetical protein
MTKQAIVLITVSGISFDNGDTYAIDRDSDEWREWLTTAPEGSKIRFEWLNSYLHRNTYTAYRRKRYWEAQKRVDGKLRNTTLKPEEATYQKLEQIGCELTAYNWDRAEQKQQSKSGTEQHYQTLGEPTLQTQEEIAQLRAEVERLKQRESYLLDQYGLLKSQFVHEAQEENERLKKQNTELDNANWECEKRVTTYSELYRKSELKRQELQSLVDNYQTILSESSAIAKLESKLQLPALEKIRDRILLQQSPGDRRKLKKAFDALISELANDVTFLA